MPPSTVMDPSTQEDCFHAMQIFTRMKNQKRLFQEDSNPSREMQKQHKRARVTDVEKSRTEQENAATSTDDDEKGEYAPTAASDKSSKNKKSVFLPLEGRNIRFLHLRHPENGPLERVMFGVTPRLLWRYASSIHIPWGNPIYTRTPPPPISKRGRSVSPHVESLRGPSPTHFRSMGSGDTPPEVNRMAHGAHWTYDYWFYDAEQEHSEDGEDDDEDEVTEKDRYGLQTPPFWYIDEDIYGRPINSKMEPFTFTPWSPPLGYSREAPY